MSANEVLRHVLLMALIAALVSCASSNSKYPTSFKTRISETGLKHFELRLAGLYYQPKQRATQNDRSPKSASRQHTKNLRTMRNTARDIVKENGFCQQDFWVLDFDIDARGHFLRGECNDQASDADRERFPDTINLW